ncbi:MAG: TetR/AcrR family transcriptional regulator [Gemmatimonadetes bacterium]|nr:MAG: TetR/AcrR family transcriptional regulator [Gemmatimonadota bacterium]PYP64522.1 MAG: TetR/AcrR family transcriptional regulator [Gemmatimonadota bacterium]
MRRYTLGRRQAAVDETRGRILRAARRLLLAKRGADFSLDAVARRARVTRLTVYHQFGSRRGLLEALFDDMAAKGGLLEALPNAFRQADPEEALARFVATFGHFWAEGRPIVRRLQALGVLDPELGKAIAGRNEWRRQGLRVIVGRLGRGASSDQAVDVLFTLTSFHTFDTLAGQRSPEAVVPVVLRLARAAVGL